MCSLYRRHTLLSFGGITQLQSESHTFTLLPSLTTLTNTSLETDVYAYSAKERDAKARHPKYKT